ncbi:MAG: SMI1/KNR4 family protein [Ruminococcaceae bacterium]|nr:SMI1/KNR4 family protein [Oscillospiraceae bacterium]
MSLEKVYDYFRNYDKETYLVVGCMGNEPTEQDIKAFEDQYKITLPEDFKDFTMSPIGGLYMEVREELWPRAKQFDVGPFWSFCRGLIVYGIAKDIPDFLDIREKTKELHDEGFTDYIPFLSIVGNGNEVFCFDKDNKIVLFDYCEGEAEPIDGTFSDCLLKQIEELEERKNRKLRGEDKAK